MPECGAVRKQELLRCHAQLGVPSRTLMDVQHCHRQKRCGVLLRQRPGCCTHRLVARRQQQRLNSATVAALEGLRLEQSSG